MHPRFAYRVLAELVGTFLFVFVGAGSAVAAGSLALGGSAVGLLIAALANGLGIAVAVSATMALSGGSLNPAMTLALFIARKVPAADVIPYIAAELFGATAAVGVLMAALPQAYGSGWGAPSLAGVTPLQGALLELVMTVFLTAAVFATAVAPSAPKIAGFGIGAAVVADVLLGGPFTGAAMNPARAMGPMLAALSIPGYWYVYWVGPVAGALIVGAAYRLLAEKA